MQTAHTIAATRAAIARARGEGQRIALVPTMGNLHDGHLRLIDAARQHADFVAASIFVNPLQFGPNEDLDAYPRTLEADQAALARLHTDLVFAPSVAEMYPDGPDLATRVSVRGLSEILCGASRPGHFDGVATVVSKLFNIVMPDVAVFGLKDYQQFSVLRRMVRDLSMGIEMVGVATARAEDGLALSSRNGYLTAAERAQAPALYATLQATAARIIAGERDYPGLLQQAREQLSAAGLRPDYVELRRAHDLAEAAADDSPLVLLAAAYLGRARLIDNLVFPLHGPLPDP